MDIQGKIGRCCSGVIQAEAAYDAFSMTAIVFHTKQWWYRQRLKKIIREYDKGVRKAKTQDERDSLESSSAWEIKQADEDILKLQTSYYIDKARHRGLPTPQSKDDWDQDMSHTGSHHLTVEAVAKLRSSIRQDKKEVRDAILPVAAIIISVIALVVSILNYRKSAAPQPGSQTTAAQSQTKK